MTVENIKYKARFHHFGAMVQESRILIENYKPELQKKVWINQVIQNNVLGKNTRVWVKELINGVFFPRFVDGSIPNIWKDLKFLLINNINTGAINSLFYYLTMKSDEFIFDYVVKEIYTRYFNGRLSISANDVYDHIQTIPEERFNNPWSEYTKRRLSRGIMSTLRDFNILEGKAQKKIANYYLPLEAFVYIAFHLKREVQSGERLLEHTDWKLFFLNTKLVERMFLEAHQQNYLGYQAAGAIIRIEFPYKNSGELIDAICSTEIRTA